MLIMAMVCLMELMSLTEHEPSTGRLVLAHKLLASDHHYCCRDWFECLLKIKDIFSSDSQTADMDYFSGIYIYVCAQPQFLSDYYYCT